MSSPTRTTIDNLGIDVSTRYASDQVKLNIPLVKDFKESSGISKKTQVGVYSPAKVSEIDALLGFSSLKHTVASFIVPQELATSQVFSYLLIPSLGSEEKQESLLQKIHEQLAKNKEERQKKKQKLNEEFSSDEEKRRKALWQFEHEEKEEEREKEFLVRLFDALGYLNKCLTDINARRNQFQQG